jgi:hypothetical protein
VRQQLRAALLDTQPAIVSANVPVPREHGSFVRYGDHEPVGRDG